MGKTSSRPAGARRRARADACCGARAARVDVEGITAERAAEGSGSEWSTSESDAAEEEEEEETTTVVSSSETAGATAGDTTARLLLASSAPAPSIPASPIHRQHAATPVKLFLATDEPGQERPVIARLFVVDDPLRPRPEPPTQRPISDTLRQHAGDWPAWDLRQSAKAKTTVAVQREDWTNTLVWDIREPPHKPPFAPPPPDTTEWTVDLTPRERAARWKYQGGGMHQPVDALEHREETIEEEKNTNVVAAADEGEESHFPFEPETYMPAEAWMSSRTSRMYGAASTSSSTSSSASSSSSNDSDAVAVNAKEIDAEVALAMDGERDMFPRAKAAAAAVARAAARAVPVHLGESSKRTSGEKRRRDRSRSRSRSPPPSARTQTPSTPRRDAEVRRSVGAETPTSDATTPSRRRRRRRVQRTHVDETRVGEDKTAGDIAEATSAAGVSRSRARGGEQPTPRELIERGKRAAARLSFAARAAR